MSILDFLFSRNARMQNTGTPSPQPSYSPMQAQKTPNMNSCFQASGQSAPQPQWQEKNNWQKFKESPFMEVLSNVAKGWAAGNTVNESLGLGAAYALKGAIEPKPRNKTIEWLKQQGFNDDEAAAYARDPNALNELLINSYRKSFPAGSLRFQNTQNTTW